ncbi:GntR family transcriptional regulator [Actinomyces sp. B33]|uniref:GntR family transcriptional regulator n=1 Tax=Actinomyces sp. B33 TaxID=2942131 RepID=UPI0023417DE2|nr:GntR family transcriptional regulator [Actinomyces sp. B33]MDC4233446.1 GntR family transcriptional regulator [Actinomyces sp. B33]
MKAKYSEVYDALVGRISRMNPGDRLESEAQLASSFNVAPMTVRRALMLLRDEGLTVARPGSGTYVAHPGARESADGEGAGACDCLLQGARLVVVPAVAPRLVSMTIAAAQQEERELFGLGGDSLVLRIVRTHWASSSVDAGTDAVGARIPVGVETFCADASRFPGVASGDLSSGSVEQALVESYRSSGGGSASCERVVEAVTAEAELCESLDIPLGSPCLRVETSIRDSQRLLVARGAVLFDGSRVSFRG